MTTKSSFFSIIIRFIKLGATRKNNFDMFRFFFFFFSFMVIFNFVN